MLIDSKVENEPLAGDPAPKGGIMGNNTISASNQSIEPYHLLSRDGKLENQQS